MSTSHEIESTTTRKRDPENIGVAACREITARNSQASKARLQSSKDTGAKQNLTQFEVVQGYVCWSH